jgi:hypothetical protein
MLKKLMLTGVAVGMMALNAPIAHAGVVQAACRFNAVAQETATGGENTFQGAAYGYAAFDDQGPHTLRCYVTVDGAEQATTPTGSGSVFVQTSGQVTYVAAEGTTVAICTEVDTVTTGCVTAMRSQIPPQEVIDLLNTIFAATGALDGVLCPILQSLAPGVGPVVITPEGDVILPDPIGKVWDCPPYDPPA